MARCVDALETARRKRNDGGFERWRSSPNRTSVQLNLRLRAQRRFSLGRETDRHSEAGERRDVSGVVLVPMRYTDAFDVQRRDRAREPLAHAMKTGVDHHAAHDVSAHVNADETTAATAAPHPRHTAQSPDPNRPHVNAPT